MAETTTLGNLPEEVMIEILARLPPESLLRFKAVRKSWYALINHDPKFTAKHFSNSLQHNHVLVKRSVTKRNSEEMENIFSILEFPYPVAIDNVRVSLDESFRYFQIRGHSHGLLCLSDLRREIFLCNPTTREIHQLPPSILLLPEPTAPPDWPDEYDSMTNAVGFGYDSKSKDFKVVRVVDFVEGPGYFHPPRVEIYDLSKDRWREIETRVCGHVFWAPSFEMFHEGTYYWWADKDGGTEIIQTFDMSEEVFGQIPVPASFKGKRERYRSLGILNGSIVLFLYPSHGFERCFDIWEMDKDGSGRVSWSKILTIGPVSGIEKPLAFVNSDELLMEASEREVVLYSFKTQEFQELPLAGHPEKFQATLFVKSLLSVKGGNDVSYEF